MTVDYLWTGRAGETAADVHLATAESPDEPVTVRAAPSAGAADRGVVGNAAVLDVQCRATGEAVTGSRGTSSDWLRVAPEGYVPAAWLATPNPPPPC